MPLAPSMELTATTDQVRIVDPLTDPLFAELSTVFPDVTPFHGSPWAQTLIRAYGHRPFYHLVEAGAAEDRSCGGPEDRRIGGSEDRKTGGTELRNHGRSEDQIVSGRPSPKLPPSALPSHRPTVPPSHRPTVPPSHRPTVSPSHRPTVPPSHRPTVPPSHRPTALLPLMEVSSWLTGRRGVALPFSDVCALLRSEGSDATHQKQSLPALWPDIVELGRHRGWRTIQLRGGPAPVPDVQPSISYHGHVLDLSGGESALFNGLHPSVRRAIRKARQSELRVELSHALDALHAYYALHTRTRQRHGLPPQPFKFFLSLYDHAIANGNAFISLVRLGVRPIAGAIFLHAGRTAVFKYGASDPTQPSLRANDLLFWETIRQLAADGFGALHFGRTDLDHEGLRRFKLGWGTREEPIHYYTYDLRANAFVVDHRRVNGRFNSLFTRLPLAVNRILGSLAYPHLD